MRAQTATEYLIILAVVIIIALIVITTLGGIPGIGGSATPGVVRATIGTSQIAISDWAVSIFHTKFSLRNNNNYLIRVDAITVNNSLCWIAGTLPGVDGIPQTIKAGEKIQLQCNTVTLQTPSTNYEYIISVNYTDLVTNAAYTVSPGKITGTSAPTTCPTNYVPVPGAYLMDKSWVDDFCVMKYEAKSNSTDVGSSAALTDTPQSRATGTPWGSIYSYNVQARCQAIGSRYRWLTDREWMVIAENIARLPINNINTTAGPVLSQGVCSIGSPILRASDYPVIVSGCDLFSVFNSTANTFSSSCQIQGQTNEYGYYQINGSYNATISFPSVDVAGGLRNNNRVHVLSSKASIWDIGGNSEEMTDVSWPITGMSSVGELYSSSTNYNGVLYLKPSLFIAGVGYLSNTGSASSDRYAARGHEYNQFKCSKAGIFTVTYSYWNNDIASHLGFRCAYTP